MKEIEKYLPKGWEAKAKEKGALKRSRHIKTAEELLALNMLYITNNGSFQMASLGIRIAKGIELNKTAAYKRIRGSWRWLRSMAEELCAEQGASIRKPAFLGEKRVILADASDETTKGKEKSTWRLHYAFDLFNFSADQMKLTGIETGEKLSNYEIRENEIWIADRIYSTMSGIEYVLSKGGDYVIRFKSKAFNLYDEKGERIELLSFLRELRALESTDIRCFYRHETKEMRPIRIVAMKKEESAVEESKRKMKRKVSKKQEKPVYEETVELNEYVVLATSLEYTNEQIIELYRARWQIEQVFYRLKSLFGYGDVPSKNEDTVKAWFYGKLFLAALCEKILKLKSVSFSPEMVLSTTLAV